jgi:hypothetical protein
MSYDIAITRMGIIARKVAEDNNWAPYNKEINPFRTQPRSVMLEFMTEYNRMLIKHERERVGYY